MQPNTIKTEVIINGLFSDLPSYEVYIKDMLKKYLESDKANALEWHQWFTNKEEISVSKKDSGSVIFS